MNTSEIERVQNNLGWLRRLYRWATSYALDREAEAARLRAENIRLRHALKPFALILSPHHERSVSAYRVFGIDGKYITVADLRAASKLSGFGLLWRQFHDTVGSSHRNEALGPMTSRASR